MIRGAASLVCEDDHDKPRVQRRYAIPSKHDELTQCCFNGGPPSSASAQHKNSIGSTPRVCWDTFLKRSNNLSFRVQISLIKNT